MPKIVITCIEARGDRITYKVMRQEGDEEAYKEFLKERDLIDIDGNTCYQSTNPKEA